MARPCITLLTDFGTADGYVGAMKGVLLAACPDVRVVDLTHEIAAGDVRGGAFALSTAAPLFPPGTIHVAVVDPGVGTARRALLVEAGGSFFVGPDNGLLAPAAPPPRRIWVLDRAEWFRQPLSATFHGRDVFAPVAARLAGGVDPELLGAPVESMLEIATAPVRREGAAVVGEVVHTDRFGNLVTSIRAADLPSASDGARLLASIGEHRHIPLCSTYGDAAAGALVALVGSSSHLEIAVNAGSAREKLGDAARLGAPVSVSPER